MTLEQLIKRRAMKKKSKYETKMSVKKTKNGVVINASNGFQLKTSFKNLDEAITNVLAKTVVSTYKLQSEEKGLFEIELTIKKIDDE